MKHPQYATATLEQFFSKKIISNARDRANQKGMRAPREKSRKRNQNSSVESAADETIDEDTQKEVNNNEFVELENAKIIAKSTQIATDVEAVASQNKQIEIDAEGSTKIDIDEKTNKKSAQIVTVAKAVVAPEEISSMSQAKRNQKKENTAARCTAVKKRKLDCDVVKAHSKMYPFDDNSDPSPSDSESSSENDQEEQHGNNGWHESDVTDDTEEKM